MSRIRIKSNPYKNEIEYEYYDMNLGKFVEINYNNSPNSKLISESFKNTLLNMNVKKIVEAIWDTYYNKDENIQIEFCGTEREYEIIKNTCQDDAYSKKIEIVKGDLKLKSETEINGEIKEIANTLGLEVKLDLDNVYNTIKNTIDLFKEEQNNINNKITEIDKRLYDINSSNDASINLLLEIIDKQRVMDLQYVKDNKPDINRITKEYVSQFVPNKKTLEEKYDTIQSHVTKRINDNDKNGQVHDNKNDKKNIIHSIITTTKKISKKGVELVKNSVQVISQTDKEFIEEVNKMLVLSLNNISDDIQGASLTSLKNREVLLKNDIQDMINKKFNSNVDLNSSDFFSDLEYTTQINYNTESTENIKFQSFRVLHYLPGVPDLNAIRNEWENIIKSFVLRNYNLCAQISNLYFSTWEEKMVNILKDKIIEIDPNLKDKAEKINELYTEQSKLNNRVNLVNSEIEKVNLLIDYY